MNLLRKCPCPVWLITCGGSRSFSRILAAVDVGEALTGILGLLMGNTAETILQVDFSVLAIKPPGFVAPVTFEA